MKKTLLLCLSVLMASIGHAQLNMTLLGRLEYDVALSNIWGWTASDGTEYALVGLYNGTSIVSLADPSNPVELFLIPGDGTIWREIKTWGNYAYVSSESGSDGLTIIDLSQLPESAPFHQWMPDIEGVGPFLSAHTLFIDEFGVLYLNGSSMGPGIVFADLNPNPIEPVYLGRGAPHYTHDCYARDNILYAAEIWNGTLSIYDVSDKTNAVLLGSQETPHAFTHNTWLNDNSQVVFTTDERAGSYVTAYDVSDPTDIRELDRFRPAATLNTPVIPHNVLVWNDWLIVAYYTDGCILVDASRPDNLIEVGNFDTFLGANGGYYGAWGAYPYFPSGNVIVSDINHGLYVFSPNYVRACFLEGKITDGNTGQPLMDTEVVIQSDQVNVAQSNIFGDYKTGQATAGTFNVRFFKTGYYPVVAQATLQNGEVTIIDVEMFPVPVHPFTGLVIQEEDGQPIANAQIMLVSEQPTYNLLSDENGAISIPAAYEGNYTVYAGSWGHMHSVVENLHIHANTPQLVIPMKKGYQDDFFFDLGWEKTPDHPGILGKWVRDVPIGTFFSSIGILSNPDSDVPDDLGDQCYVTGNGGGIPDFDDVEWGKVFLKSPVMDLTSYEDPVISYNAWFYNGVGNGFPNDSLVVRLSNGIQSIVLETIKQPFTSGWRPRSRFYIAPLLNVTESMTVTFETGDDFDYSHLVEAAVDAFLVADEVETATAEVLPVVAVTLAPNPFSGVTHLSYRLEHPAEGAVVLTLSDVLGRQVQQKQMDNRQGTISLGENLQAGCFFATITLNGQVLKTLRLVKVD